MSESTSNLTATSPIGPNPPQDPSPPADNRTLVRVLGALVVLTILAIVGFGVFYYLGQRVQSGPTQLERLISSSEAAVRKSPNDVGARLNLAAAYVQADRTPEAVTQFQEIIKADPKNRQALLGMASLNYDKGDMKAAREQYSSVIDLTGKGEFAGADMFLQAAYYYRGMIGLREKDSAGAVADLTQATTISASDADAWYQLGNAQLAAGKSEDAAKAFHKALAFIPSGWCEPYDGLATAYASGKNADGTKYATAMGAICKGDNSATQLKVLEQLATGDFRIPAMLGLAGTAESTGDTAAARKWYEQVLLAEPRNVTAVTAVSRLGTGTPITSTAPTAPASQP